MDSKKKKELELWAAKIANVCTRAVAPHVAKPAATSTMFASAIPML